MSRLRGPLAGLLVLVLVLGVAPSAAVASPAPDKGKAAAAADPVGGWKPESKRNWWDRLKGWFGDDGPKTGKIRVPAGVPRREALPRRKAAPPARRVKELTGQRTASTRTWLLSDGRRQVELSGEPVNYRRDGRWRPIDTRVRASRREGFALANTTNDFASYFGTGQVGVELPGGASLTVGASDQSRVRPRARGEVVTYHHALKGADVVYRVGARRLKEEIVLDRAPGAPLSYAFAVRARGLRAWQRRDGSIAFYRGEFAGDPVAVLAAPFMVDAASARGRVAQSMRWDGRAGLLRVTVRPDAGFLTDPRRRFPVVVDPTIEVEPPGLDSSGIGQVGQFTHAVMVDSAAPTTNFSATQSMQVGAGTTGVKRALVKFPLNSIPAGARIDAADLRLFYDQVHTTNANAVTVEAHQATVGWSEQSVNWNTVSGAVGPLSATVTQVDDGDAGRTAANGTWALRNTFDGSAINNDLMTAKNATAGDDSFTWTPQVPQAGNYLVEVHYKQFSDNATAAPYTVTFNGGTQTVNVDQSSGGAGAGVWKSLGTFSFAAGTAGSIKLGDVANQRVVADAVRLTRTGTQVKAAGEPLTTGRWHSFPVGTTVQSWIDDPASNDGFIIKAADETLGKGGPVYRAADPATGDTSTNPTLVVTLSKPGVDLPRPTTVHATGAELSWTPYAGSDIAEYQVHRSATPVFFPSAKTLVAPIGKNTTSFTDTTALPTPAASPNPQGSVVYYQVAVKLTDGTVIPSTTQMVRLPKAGRVIKTIPATITGAADTTLNSAEPDVGHDQVGGQPVLAVGSDGTNKTRALVKVPAAAVPSNAAVLDARIHLDAVSGPGTSSTTPAFTMQGLAKDFSETAATWNKADATTVWATPGGDVDTTIPAAGGVRAGNGYSFPATALAARWAKDPATNHGVLIKLANEASPVAETHFASAENTALPTLQPALEATFLEKTTDSTFFAPFTPARMIPGDQYPIDVTLTNTTATTWRASERVLSYHWKLPDGTDVTNSGNQLQTPIPTDLQPGESVTVTAQVKTPIQSDSGNKRTDFVLNWDLFNTATGTWLSDSDQIPPLAQNVAVEDPTSNQLGLEKFYQYAGTPTGAGSTAMTNLFSGNTLWSYNALTNPSRGPETFLRLAYNSQDSSDTGAGFGWSVQPSTLMRLGSPLDFQPNPHPTEVTLTDGDGTSHVFTLADDKGTTDPTDDDWKAPAGVHFWVKQLSADCAPNAEIAEAWEFTRPDRTRFIFDCDGYLTSIVDNNGNTQTFTYERKHSNNKPIKLLRYITDAAGRQTLTLDYYNKGEDYSFIDDAGIKQQATNLNNPFIIDHLKQITDISGRRLTSTYTDNGLLGELIDGAEDTTKAKTFEFAYDATQGNKNVKLVGVTDPRGHHTTLAYYDPPGDDPQFHWWTRTITDRLGNPTGFAYTDPDAQAGSTIQTVVTDPENHASTYLMDGFGRPTQATNARNQTTKLAWDTDNNVQRLEEPPATTGATPAVTTYVHDPNTGYPLNIKDAEANKNGWPGTTLTYQTGLSGHIADLISKKSSEGRLWTFGYDTNGNLTTLTDPDGNATSTADDFTSTNTYDSLGQLRTAKDANGHTTTYSAYDANGYPQTITDPLGDPTHYTYDERGQVTKVTDALNHDTTQAYDLFGRPLAKTEPKDQANGVLITTPAPVYDANDNVTKTTAPNGAVSTAAYDDADRVTDSFEPPDTGTSPVRKTSYAYDKVGNVTKVTEPKGTLTTSDGTDFVTTYGYDEIYENTSVTNADNDKLTYGYDNIGNVTTVADPRKNAAGSGFTTKYTYDLDHRVTAVTDAANNTTKTTYDRDGLTVASTDQDNTTTTIQLDARGKPIQVTAPHTAGSSNVTQYEYDQVGNRTKVITPRGVATTGVADDFVQETRYDELNRVAQKLSPYDPGDARYNHADATTYDYDPVGRLSKVSTPPSEGQSVRNDTTYSYFDNGWAKTSTDPWDITTTYDYNEIGKQTSRTLTSAGGSSSRTMSWTYYPDGKLKTRTDDGVPVGRHVVLVDDSDFQNAGFTGSGWTSSNSGTGFQGYDYASHAAGTGTNSFVWKLTIPQDGTYQAFAKYPTVSGAATNAAYTIHDGNGGDTTKTIDQTSGGGTWVPLGSFTFKRDGSGQQIKLTDGANGTVLADAVKLVRTPTETDNEKTDFGYAYDPNGNVTDITDNSPGSKVDDYAVTYDGLDQVFKVEEKLSGTVKHTTTFTYDENGDPRTRVHDAESATYDYDARNMVSKITDKETATDTPKVTSFTYTPRGQRDLETKGNGNVVDSDYFLDGLLQHQVEKKPNGAIVAEHTFTYDPNGNKAQDVAKKMNADNHAAFLNTTTNWTYDPLDRIAKVTKTGDVSETETYTHDPNDNVISETIKGTTTTFNYDRNRLLTAVTNGITSDYNYDPFGRLDTVTAAGQVIERDTYDGFDHVKENQERNSSGALVSTRYTYDPLDRTSSKTTDPGGANEKTTDYNYLGTADQVLDEDVAGKITKTYQYTPWGERLSQVKTNTDGSKEDAYYGYNDHSDVETLTDANGDTKATYGYTAYGQTDDAETTGIDKPDPADPTKEPYNAYRYEAKRFDPSSGTYDMGFRDYNPGLNQFLTRDTYAGALSDMNLAVDPFTANRYAFGGGNPVSAVEIDGHNWLTDKLKDGAEWLGNNAGTIAQGAADTLGLIAGVASVGGGLTAIAAGLVTCVGSAAVGVAGAPETFGGSLLVGGAGCAAGLELAAAGVVATAGGLALASQAWNNLNNLHFNGGDGGSTGLRSPRPGSTDGGPGQWVEVPAEGGSEAAWSAQERLTGVSRYREYEVTGNGKTARFDTYNNGKLIDVKDNYSSFYDKNGFKRFFEKSKKGLPKLLETARRQTLAADGTPVEWWVHDEQFAKLLRQAFAKANEGNDVKINISVRVAK